jgi:predicted ATP-dependent serine protease
LERRLDEAARRGFTRAVIPRGLPDGARPKGLEILEVRDISEAIASISESSKPPGVTFSR